MKESHLIQTSGLTLINRIRDKGTFASSTDTFVFETLYEGARSRRYYKIRDSEIAVVQTGPYGGGEIMKNDSFAEKLSRVASEMTPDTLSELADQGFQDYAAQIQSIQKKDEGTD